MKGFAEIDGHNDYDLVLRPVTEPEEYRLREVWVNAHTFATDRLMSQGNFMVGGVTQVPWLVTFKQIDGATYVQSEQTKQSFSLERHAYDSASVSFENIATASIPSWAQISKFEWNRETGVPPLTEP